MRIIVRPLNKSELKHFSTIQLDVWTSRLVRVDGKRKSQRDSARKGRERQLTS